jgi:phosphoglycolate phosphatase-like HAD superfamily hydrolase
MTTDLTPIAIDFDGVAWPLVDSLGQLPDCPEWQGERLTTQNCSTWDTVIDIWGQGLDYAFAKMDEARSLENLRRIGLFAGFAEAMQTLEARSFRPTILSHNSEAACAGIRTYLDERGLGHIEMIAARPAEKIEWCLAEGAEILVDDAPDTIRAAHAAGLTPVAPRYLYNADAIAETGAIWGHDWKQLLPLLLVAATRTRA